MILDLKVFLITKNMRATRPHSCGSLFCDCEYSTGSCIKLYSKLNPTKTVPDKKLTVKREEPKDYDNYQKILLNQYYQSKPSASTFSPGGQAKRKSSQVSSNKHSFLFSNDRTSLSAKKVSFSDRNNVNNVNSTKSIKLSDTNRRSRIDSRPRKSSSGADGKGTFIRLSTIWKAKDNVRAEDLTRHLSSSHEPKRSIYLQNQPISFVELLNERNPKCSLIKIEDFETIEYISSDEEDFYWNKEGAFTNKMGKLITIPNCNI